MMMYSTNQKTFIPVIFNSVFLNKGFFYKDQKKRASHHASHLLNEKSSYAALVKITSVITALIMLTSQAMAQSTTQQLNSISYGNYQYKITTEIRRNVTESNKLVALSDQQLGIATTSSRTILANRQMKPTYQNHTIGVEFSFYDAQTYLEEDLDGDGYYQTISINFDADIYSFSGVFSSEVYAELYISRGDEPWQHFYTTDNFFITADSSEDSYEVISTFLSGYPSDHYDVLIDLYQVGYSEVVASYSAYDSASLYAIPIESADDDQPYIEYYEEHGGSISLTFIFVALLLRIFPLKHR